MATPSLGLRGDSSSSRADGTMRSRLGPDYVEEKSTFLTHAL